MPSIHEPVLLDQVVFLLAPQSPGLLVDVTLGLGGHSAALLAAYPELTLLGVDRDPAALAVAEERLAPFAGRFRLLRSEFDRLPEVLAETASPAPVAILADLGCSSMQLDQVERGFSFSADGPLDMRMGGQGRSAADIVNSADEEDLVKILRDYGEERRARAITRAIIGRRSEGPITTTGELSRLVIDVLGYRPDRIHPATRTFQGIRIAVNDELGQLERFLEPAVHSLAPQGRIAVISFHSLEDRIVKHTLRRLEGRCVCPPDFPICTCNPKRHSRTLTKKVVRPDDDEVERNPRSRSARLRAAQRAEDAS